MKSNKIILAGILVLGALVFTNSALAYNPNPSTVGPFPKSGEVRMYFATTGNYTAQLSGNGQSAFHNAQSGRIWDTGINVNAGDTLSIKMVEIVGYNGDFVGWINPVNNTCGKSPFGPWNVSQYIGWAQGFGEPLVSEQCWADAPQPGRDDTYDFEDVFVMFSYVPGTQPATPSIDIKINGSDGPVGLACNQTGNLSWTSTNASSCVASGSWSGSKAISGFENTGIFSGSRTYSIACTGSGGTATDSVTVTSSTCSVPPTVDIKANGSDGPINISCNDSANLSWTSTNASSCVALGSWSGTKSVSGFQSTGNIDFSKTYTIQCTGTGGVTTDSVVVSVNSCHNSPGLTIHKTARNLDSSQSGYTSTVHADPNDDIRFKIEVISNGDSIVEDVVVRDVLPGRLDYKGGLDVGGYYRTGSITSGLGLGNLSPGESRVIYFTAEVDDSSQFNTGTTSLNNIAYVMGDNFSQVSDVATVKVESEGDTNISVSKQVRNLSDGHTRWYETVSATPGERIEFKITVRIDNSDADNVILKDSLIEKMVWHGNIEIDGHTSSDQNILNGIDLGDLDENDIVTITYDVLLTTEPYFVYGTTRLVNSARAYNTDDSATDTAQVNVVRQSVAGDITEIPTGVLDNLALSLGITFIVTYSMLFGYYIYKKGFPKLDLGVAVQNKSDQTKSKLETLFYKVNPFTNSQRSEKELDKLIAKVKKEK